MGFAMTQTLAKESSPLHVFAAAWLGLMFDGMDATIFVLVMYPALSELLHTTSHAAVGACGGIVIATFMIGWAVGASVFGIVADLIGRTKAMIMTILLYALFSGLCATSHTWIELAFFRFLVGCGIGGEQTTGVVLLAETWKRNARLHATSLMTTAFGFGYLLAGLLNTWLAPFGWRALFLAGIIPALLTVYIRATLKDPLQFQLLQECRRRAAAGQINWRETSPGVFSKFLILFNPENRKKVFAVACLSSTAIVGFWAVLSWIPPWINQLTGTLAVTERTNAAIIMNLGTILSGVLGGFIVLKMGRKNAFRFTFSCALLSAIGLFLTVKTFNPWIFPWLFLLGFFAQLPFQCIFMYAPELFGNEIRASAVGSSIQCGRFVGALAAVLGGQLIAFFGGSYALAGSCVALFYLVGLVATFFLPETNGNVDLDSRLALLANQTLELNAEVT